MWAHIIGGSATKSFCFSCGNKMPFAGAPATCDLIPQSGNTNTCPLRHETVSYPEYKKGSYRSIDKQGGPFPPASGAPGGSPGLSLAHQSCFATVAPDAWGGVS